MFVVNNALNIGYLSVGHTPLQLTLLVEHNYGLKPLARSVSASTSSACHYSFTVRAFVCVSVCLCVLVCMCLPAWHFHLMENN